MLEVETYEDEEAVASSLDKYFVKKYSSTSVSGRATLSDSNEVEASSFEKYFFVKY